jgi:hypothetical protein
MAQRRDSKGRFASGSGSGGSSGSSKSVVNPMSKAAQNRAEAKRLGMTFGAYLKMKAKAGRKEDKAQNAKRLADNRKRKALDAFAKKNEGKSWQEVRDGIRRRRAADK